jgi:hypothetical protein
MLSRDFGADGAARVADRQNISNRLDNTEALARRLVSAVHQISRSVGQPDHRHQNSRFELSGRLLPPGSVNALLQLQQYYGNRYVRRVLGLTGAGVIQRASFTPPKTSKLPASPAPWHDVWVGQVGVVFEVVRDGIPVRVLRKYEQLNLKDWRTLVCEQNAWPDPADLRTRMVAAGEAVAAQNPRVIPESAAAHRVHLVVFGDYETGYYPYKGHGAIIFHSSFNPDDYNSAVVHELSHGLFEFHRIGATPEAPGAPDKVLLGVESLFEQLKRTAKVPIPMQKFDPQNPPPLQGEGDQEAAGLVMFTDVLWAGAGGHPWDDAHELFASAYAGNLLAPELLREIIAHYQKADPAIAPLAEKLLMILVNGASRDVGDSTGTHITPSKSLPEIAEIGWTAEPETMYQPVTESTYCMGAEQPDLGF